MSRTSLYKRMIAMKDEVYRRDPLLAVLHSLTPAERRIYDIWRAECDRIVTEYEEQGAGRYFEALINGEQGFWVPQLRPRELREKIFGKFEPDPTMTIGEVYQEMCR